MAQKTKTPIERFKTKFVVTETGCWAWRAAKSTDNYGHFGLHGKVLKAHKVSYLLFRGEIPADLCVLHTCDNSLCVNPSHLYLGTVKQNIADRVARGRSRGGVVKLAIPVVSEIRRLLETGVKQKDVAERYGVSKSLISAISLKKRRILHHEY